MPLSLSQHISIFVQQYVHEVGFTLLIFVFIGLGLFFLYRDRSQDDAVRYGSLGTNLEKFLWVLQTYYTECIRLEHKEEDVEAALTSHLTRTKNIMEKFVVPTLFPHLSLKDVREHREQMEALTRSPQAHLDYIAQYRVELSKRLETLDIQADDIICLCPTAFQFQTKATQALKFYVQKTNVWSEEESNKAHGILTTGHAPMTRVLGCSYFYHTYDALHQQEIHVYLVRESDISVLKQIYLDVFMIQLSLPWLHKASLFHQQLLPIQMKHKDGTPLMDPHLSFQRMLFYYAWSRISNQTSNQISSLRGVSSDLACSFYDSKFSPLPLPEEEIDTKSD